MPIIKKIPDNNPHKTIELIHKEYITHCNNIARIIAACVKTDKEIQINTLVTEYCAITNAPIEY